MAGSANVDLEALRAIFRDRRTWIDVGKVDKVEVSGDGVEAWVQVQILPDGRKIIAKETFAECSEGSMLGQCVIPNDLVVIGYDESDEADEAYIIARINTEDDAIHQRVIDGGMMVRARDGQKTSISSDTAVLIGTGGDTEEAEPLVLGEVFKAAFEVLHDRITAYMDTIIAGPIGVGNIGIDVPTHPGIISGLGAQKTLITLDKLTFDDFLSEIAFTEK